MHEIFVGFIQFEGSHVDNFFVQMEINIITIKSNEGEEFKK